HKQITQLVKELKSNTVYRPKMAVLGGRNHYCIHRKVKKAADKNDACQELVDAAGCHFKHKAEDLFQEMARGANIIWDMEDLVQKGEAMDDIRKAMEIELDNAIVILDEAHNIESTARDAGGLEVLYDDLRVANRQFVDMIAEKVFENTCKKLLDFSTMFLHIMDEQTTFKINNYEESIEVLTSQAWIERLNQSGLNQHSIDYYRQACEKISKAIKDKKELQKPHPAKEVARLSLHEKEMIGRVFLSLRMMRVLEGIIVITDRLFNCNPDDLDDYKIAIMESVDRGRVKVDMEDTDDDGQNKTRGSKNQRKGQTATKKKEILFWCLNPGVIFRPISTRARSVILTSGTLSPLDSFASELQTPFAITLEADHVVDKSHVWAGVIPWGPTKVKLDGAYKSINTFGFQDELGRVIEEVIATTPHGILCFVSSYSTIDNLVKRWQQTGQYDKLCAIKEVIIEPRNATNKVFDDTLNKFYTVIADEVAKGSDGGALLFAVYRGKCSEGIDFTDSNCRAVLAVSIPFPSVNDQKIKLKMDYNQKRSVRRPMPLQLQPVPPPRPQSLLDIDLQSINHSTSATGAGAIPALSVQQYRPPILLSGKRWYEIQAFRAYNQAIGRCIRHRKDWGAMVLLDYRLNQPHNLHSLSKWARPLAKSFPVFEDAMKDMKAWIAPLQKASQMEASLSSSSSSGTVTEPAPGETHSMFADSENYMAVAEAPGMMASKKTTFNSSSIIEQARAAVKSELSSQPDSGAMWMIDLHGDHPDLPDDTDSEDMSQEQGFFMKEQETIKIESDAEDMGIDENMEGVSWATPPEGSPEPGLPTKVPANEEDMFHIAAEDVSMFSGDDDLDMSQMNPQPEPIDGVITGSSSSSPSGSGQQQQQQQQQEAPPQFGPPTLQRTNSMLSVMNSWQGTLTTDAATESLPDGSVRILCKTCDESLLICSSRPNIKTVHKSMAEDMLANRRRVAVASGLNPIGTQVAHTHTQVQTQIPATPTTLDQRRTFQRSSSNLSLTGGESSTSRASGVVPNAKIWEVPGSSVLQTPFNQQVNAEEYDCIWRPQDNLCYRRIMCPKCGQHELATAKSSSHERALSGWRGVIVVAATGGTPGSQDEVFDRGTAWLTPGEFRCA
ncbi:Fanconi anemia group J protein, partial [Podila epicladia]